MDHGGKGIGTAVGITHGEQHPVAADAVEHEAGHGPLHRSQEAVGQAVAYPPSPVVNGGYRILSLVKEIGCFSRTGHAVAETGRGQGKNSEVVCSRITASGFVAHYQLRSLAARGSISI